jgi:hypothetical protein
MAETAAIQNSPWTISRVLFADDHVWLRFSARHAQNIALLGNELRPSEPLRTISVRIQLPRLGNPCPFCPVARGFQSDCAGMDGSVREPESSFSPTNITVRVLMCRTVILPRDSKSLLDSLSNS